MYVLASICKVWGTSGSTDKKLATVVALRSRSRYREDHGTEETYVPLYTL